MKYTPVAVIEAEAVWTAQVLNAGALEVLGGVKQLLKFTVKVGEVPLTAVTWITMIPAE